MKGELLSAKMENREEEQRQDSAALVELTRHIFAFGGFIYLLFS